MYSVTHAQLHTFMYIYMFMLAKSIRYMLGTCVQRQANVFVLVQIDAFEQYSFLNNMF